MLGVPFVFLCTILIKKRHNSNFRLYKDSKISLIRYEHEKKCNVQNISGCINAIDMIFEEFIQNAIKVAEHAKSITLSFDVENDIEHEDTVIFSILNTGSSIPRHKRAAIGEKLLSDSSEGGGFGYRIIESLLKGIEAIEYEGTNMHFKINYDDDNMSFKFNFKTLLI